MDQFECVNCKRRNPGWQVKYNLMWCLYSRGVFSTRDSEQMIKNLMERKEPPYYLACEHSRFSSLLSGEEQGETAVFAGYILRTLRSNDADGNQNVKKTIGLISKTTTPHVLTLFWYISFPFLHDYDVKIPIFAFYGGRKQATTKFYFPFLVWIWSLEIQLKEGSPTIDKVSG